MLGLFAWEKGRQCVCWHQTAVRAHSVMVCVCVTPQHRHTVTVVYCPFIWLTPASTTTNSFSDPHTGKKKKKKCSLPTNGWAHKVYNGQQNAASSAGYYFYSFKHIPLASRTTDSFSLPHTHPHTGTRTVQKLSPPTNRTAKPTRPILGKNTSCMSESRPLWLRVNYIMMFTLVLYLDRQLSVF